MSICFVTCAVAILLLVVAVGLIAIKVLVGREKRFTLKHPHDLPELRRRAQRNKRKE